ncbi:MAG: hypothetical protein H7Y32_10545 [Chloroflexales bacterium]|nr:hypothetical protein [Chloroflexales bacterium]
MATLHIGDVVQAGEPTALTIKEGLDALARDEAEFLIVVRDEAQNHFAQVASMRGGLFLLEYRNAYGQVAADEPFDVDELAAVLLAYAQGDDSWAERYSWAPVEI